MRTAFEIAAKKAVGTRKKYLEAALSREGLVDNFGRPVANTGICAFSVVARQTVMWTHYADEHRGVCILYNFPQEFFEFTKSGIIGVDKVNYSFRDLVETLVNYNDDSPSFGEELLKRYFTTKGSQWRHEEEVRIVRQEPGRFPISGDFIEQICFGLQTPDADVDLVIKLARAHTGCVRFAKMTRSANGFGFKLMPL